MKRTIHGIIILFISLTLFISQVYASPIKMHPAISQEISLSKSKLNNLEGILKGIEERKLLKEEDLQNLEKELYDYASVLKDMMIKAAKGARENPGALGAAENEIKEQEKRVKNLVSRVEGINREMKNGKIIPDKKLLEKMSPAEREKFLRSLTPEGRKEIEKRYPHLFKTSTLNYLKNVFSPKSAEAKIAEPCLPACAGSTLQNISESCRQCVEEQGLVPKVLEAWNNFVGCWKGCGGSAEPFKLGCPHPMCILCKFQCLLVFIGVLL